MDILVDPFRMQYTMGPIEDCEQNRSGYFSIGRWTCVVVKYSQAFVGLKEIGEQSQNVAVCVCVCVCVCMCVQNVAVCVCVCVCVCM